MSSASTSSLNTNKAPGTSHLAATVNSQKAAQKPKGAGQCRTAFSIDEILKPSFGAKTCMEVDSTQPLDMRTDRNNTIHVISENEKLRGDVNAGQCPLRSSSPDQRSDSTSRSSRSDSSPASRHRSSSADSNSCEYDQLNQEYKSGFCDAQMIPPYTASMFSFEDLHYIMSRSYYNTLSHVYGCTNNAVGRNFFHHLGQIRRFMNTHSGATSLSGNYICSSIDACGNTSLNILTANKNTNYVPKPKQAGTPHATNRFPSKATDASQETSSASQLNSTTCPGSGRTRGHSAAGSDSGRKQGHTAAGFGPGDSQANVRSGETCISEDRGSGETRISEDTRSGESRDKLKAKLAWPAWVYCTRYSDRPSSGPRFRKPRIRPNNENDKRPRTAFSTQQLHRLRLEFETCPYLSEARRQSLALDLGLNESQVKIWFQNKRAKLKKSTGSKNQLALRLMEEGLYNHSTIVVDVDSNKCDPRQDMNGER